MAAPDWSVHLLQLAARGELGRVSRTLLLDLPALAQPWACRTGACTPGQRAADARSCCADLEVQPSPEERAAIEAALPALAPFLAARDPRWATPIAPFDGEALRRPGRRCVFALPPVESVDDGGRGGEPPRNAPPDASGLSCALHAFEDATGRPRGALKPLPCRLFPLVLVDIEDGRTLLSAVAPRTWRLAGSRPARAFPCLGAAGLPSVMEACADTVAALHGPAAARKAVGLVQAWREQASQPLAAHEPPR